MDLAKRWYRENLAKKVIEALKDKGYNALYAEDVSALRALVASLIPQGARVATGGSMTLEQTQVMADIKNGAYEFIDRHNYTTPEEKRQRQIEGFSADFFVTSTNAITKKGELINIDGYGNRVSAIEFGPKNVIIVAGTNKIVRDINEGILRAKQIAPINAKRLNCQTPCAVDGVCHDCKGAHRICNITSIIHNCYRQMGRITVILVPQELGY